MTVEVLIDKVNKVGLIEGLLYDMPPERKGEIDSLIGKMSKIQIEVEGILNRLLGAIVETDSLSSGSNYRVHDDRVIVPDAKKIDWALPTTGLYPKTYLAVMRCLVAMDKVNFVEVWAAQGRLSAQVDNTLFQFSGSSEQLQDVDGAVRNRIHDALNLEAESLEA